MQVQKKGFEHFFNDAKNPQWGQRYFCYRRLKAKLSEFVKRRLELKGGNSRKHDVEGPRIISSIAETPGTYKLTTDDGTFDSVPLSAQNPLASEIPVEKETQLSPTRTEVRRGNENLFEIETYEFAEILDEEIEGVHQFYIHQEGVVSGIFSRTPLTDKDSRRVLCDAILELYAYVCTNIIALRQILLRYDMFLRTFAEGPLFSSAEVDPLESYDFSENHPVMFSHWYLETRSLSTHESHLVDLLRHESLIRVTALFTARMRELLFDLTTDSIENFDYSSPLDLSHDLNRFIATLDKFEEAVAATQKSAERASFGHRLFKDRFVYDLRHFFLVGSIMDGLGLFQPQFLVLMRGKTFRTEMKFFAEWRRTRAINLDRDINAWKKYVPFVLNFVSMVLYVMNYFIVEPSSTQYVNFLGGHDALVGVLIGAMPWAAFISALFYSMATNFNYKYPMIFSGLMLTLGNLAYSAAYNRGSLAWVFVGRAMCGLGEPRVINRRFVADTVSCADRTAASATFAVGSAIGSTLGPAMAIALDKFNAEYRSLFGGSIYLNGMTNPGYFMFVLWMVYTILTVFLFEEPERVGILEQTKLEKAAVEVATASTGQFPPPNAGAKSGGRREPLLVPASGVEIESIPTSTMKSVNSVGSDEMSSSLSSEEVADGIVSCFRAMTPAVYICMFMELVSQFSVETLSSAISVLTKNRYGWEIDQVGSLAAVNGLLIIPVSILVGWSSQYHKDRVLMLRLLALAALGSFMLVDITDLLMFDSNTYNESRWLSVGPSRYVVGIIVFFSSIHAVESVNMAMFSKVVPVAMARGTFNCGLLATMVGTLGRLLGDVFITCMGLASLRNLMNLLYAPVGVVLVLCIVLFRSNHQLFNI